MKIDLDWIQKELDAGHEVKLEGGSGYYINKDNYVLSIDGDDLVVGFDTYKTWISPDNFKYFRIKRSTMTFKDLINVAVQAVEDELIVIDFLNNHKIVLHQIKHTEFITFESLLDVEKGIDFINSLYTETFVIESEQDVLNAKDESEILFTNGEKGVFADSTGDGHYGFILIANVIHRVPFPLLKGATVTQKRGEQ